MGEYEESIVKFNQINFGIMIELAKHERQTMDCFMQDVVAVPEVRAAFLISGRYELIVHVVARALRAVTSTDGMTAACKAPFLCTTF